MQFYQPITFIKVKSFADLVRSKTWTNDSNSTEALEAYNVSYIVNALEA
jgi:hypothetical protein